MTSFLHGPFIESHNVPVPCLAYLPTSVDRSLTDQRSLLAVAGLDALDGELRQLEVGAELDGLAVRVPFQQELPRCLGD